MLDTTRGVAVLGILLLNIVGFGLPEAYEDPTNWGGHEGANLFTWEFMSLFFEGTMRGLFTLLFGAGALLFLSRNMADSTPGRTKLYYRRTVLLILFGLINAYVLLWEGDILFYYGVVGLFLFFFRNLSVPKLVLLGIAALSVPTLMNAMEQRDYSALLARVESAEMAHEAGEPLTPDQEAAMHELGEVQQNHKPAMSGLEYHIERMTHSYGSAFRYLMPRTFYWETTFFIQYGFAECLGMMLLGMALLKTGILTGNASARTYRMMMMAGYAVGLAVNLWETNQLQDTDFSVDAIIATYVTYDLGRVPMTFGHLGLIGMLWLSPVLVHTKRVLGYVGQMALTNYLTQSLICMLLFTGAGFSLFGQLERHQLYGVVAAIWIAQLWWSPWWLRRFRFGPAEWLWRSLTYGRRQPMRLDLPGTCADRV